MYQGVVLYFSFLALPSAEDRQREVAKLKKIFENYGETVPVIDLHETSSDDEKESVTKVPRLVVTFLFI
jgi:hypothetical protein